MSKARIQEIETELQQLERLSQQLIKEQHQLELEIRKSCLHEKKRYINLGYESGWYCENCDKKM